MDEDLGKLQGKWKLIALKKDGIAAGPGEISGTFIVFEKNSFVETAPDYEFGGKFSVCSGASHPGIDLEIPVNCACEKRVRGIYAFEDNLLKICSSENENAPDILDSKPGMGWTLKIFKKM